MVNITQISPTIISQQTEYSTQDENLISSFDVDTKLGTLSHIEYNVYDLNNNLLYNTYNYNSYSVKNDGQSAQNDDITQIILNPETDLENLGFEVGEYNVYYNILSYKVGSNLETLYISEISSDRTEIRLDSNNIDNTTLQEQLSNFIDERENSEYFLDFYLNFGENNLILSNNIVIVDEDPTNTTILIKLYEPLPNSYNIKSEVWVAASIDDPLAYNVEFIEEPIVFIDTTPIKGPNFNIDLKDQVNNSTLELSYSDIVSTSSPSMANQLDSLLEEKEIDINIDYSDFTNYIHFSSAETRLENFYYKVNLLEGYSSSIAIINTNITGSTSSSLAVSESKAIIDSKVNDIIKNFDHYEYFLYYESSSYAWPKTNTSPQYQLSTVGSNEVLNWFGSTNEDSPLYGGLILSASRFDDSNKDNLLYSIPEYLREDSENYPYELFINMVAQHYDNIWIYIKDVTQKFNSDNRLNFGVSKDLVADTIRDFGVKLYQNNFSNEDIFTAFLGLTPEGSLFPFPNITGSLPTPSGYEYVDTLISASNDYIPLDDVNKSLYKRIYHNLPYLLKSKGTIPGLRALITSYGIPDTILRISEFGGKDKVNENDWDYYYNKFNYSFNTEGTNFISSSWDVNSTFNSPSNNPSTVELRFKAESILPTNVSQSIFSLYNGSTLVSDLTLEYTGSGLTTASYSGSAIDPNSQYATLKWIPDTTSGNSASIYLPFFNEGWWSVMITSGSSNGFELTAANKIYNGNDGTSIGFISSSFINTGSWVDSTLSYFATSSLQPGFSGSLQEIRYYSTILGNSSFKDYVMNPLSIEGNSINSSPNELIFRASLGGELDILSSESIHPRVTGSWVSTSSFSSNSNFTFNSTPTYEPNTEYYFLDQPAVGIKNRISDKIRIENSVLPSGDVLSPFQRLSQTQTNISASYTPNINLLEVAFSPQNEINDDIINQLGYFNIGEYIGDPSFRTNPSDTYPDLDLLRNAYFEKYIKNYDLFDFIRLIKYFDNSLFKMIKDFIPARTSLSSGIVIKQHILERNRYKNTLVNPTTQLAKYLSQTPSSGLVDVITNGDFATGDLTGWTTTGTVAVSAGACTLGTSFGVNTLYQDVLTTGTYYTVSFDVISYSGTVVVRDDDGTILHTIVATGATPFSFTHAAVGGNIIFATTSPSAALTIDNISVTKTVATTTTSYGTPISTKDLTLTGTVNPQWNNFEGGRIVNTSGEPAGSVIKFNSINTSPYGVDGNGPDNIYNITQSWFESNPTISGSAITLHSSQDEFYNGEFSGSTLVVTTQDLNSGCDPFKKINPTGVNFDGIRMYSGSEYNFNDFIDVDNQPTNGYISMWYQTPADPSLPPSNPTS